MEHTEAANMSAAHPWRTATSAASLAKRLADCHTRTFASWQKEVLGFVTERIGHNGEAYMALTGCANPADALRIEGTWLTVAVEDYIKGCRRMAALADDTATAMLRLAAAETPDGAARSS